MVDALILATIFLGIASVFALPLAVVLGIPAVALTASRWLRLKERELELRRLETAARVRAMAGGRLPAWVDASDPEALLAWARADTEIDALELR